MNAKKEMNLLMTAQNSPALFDGGR